MTYPITNSVLRSLIETPPGTQSSCSDNPSDRNELDTIQRFQDAGFILLKNTPTTNKQKGLYWPETNDYKRWIDEGRTPFIPEMSIVHHPFGRYRASDIAVRERGNHIHLLECKSSNRDVSNIHFNSSLPNKDILYLLTDLQKTIILRGDQIVPVEEHVNWERYELLLNQVPKPYSSSIHAWIRIYYKILQSRRLFEQYGDHCSKNNIDRLLGKKVSDPMIVKNWEVHVNMWELSVESVELMEEN